MNNKTVNNEFINELKILTDISKIKIKMSMGNK